MSFKRQKKEQIKQKTASLGIEHAMTLLFLLCDRLSTIFIITRF